MSAGFWDETESEWSDAATSVLTIAAALEPTDPTTANSVQEPFDSMGERAA
jgi:hypothetical protein